MSFLVGLRHSSKGVSLRNPRCAATTFSYKFASNLTTIRLYSNKYRNIDEFNKSKTEYDFNKKIDIPGESTDEIHSKISQQMKDQEIQDINALLEKDPRLQSLPYGSPDYKEMLDHINKEFTETQKKNHHKYESRERWKALFFGIGIVTSVAIVHQFLFHYKWYKSVFNKRSYDIDEETVKVPKKSFKNLDHLTTKLAAIIDNKFVDGILDSKESTGLYVYGSHNSKKLPTRIDFFNDMLLNDVKISNGLLVVVADDGKAYQYTKKSKSPKQISLPSKVVKCEVSSKFVYFLDKSGGVCYVPRPDQPVSVSFYKTWFGLKKQKGYEILKFGTEENLLGYGEKIKEMSCGDSHMLMLSNKGRLFNVKTGEGENYGQFGLPNFAPVINPKIPLNEVFEMTLLNNELSVVNGDKIVKPRVFQSICAGKYHNLASDSSSNVWAWGKNSYGQCGVEVHFQRDAQPVPTKVFHKAMLNKIVNAPIAGITDIYANEETSLINVKLEDDSDVLISFGNGLKGQLGINRYLHLCHQPQKVKSLSLTEFDESANKLKNIPIKSISSGTNHTVVQLDNSGTNNDVFIFGDNEFGQFGNGKQVKSPKPITVPNLIEPKDIQPVDMRKMAKRIADPDNRLSLSENLKIKGVSVEQIIQATGDNTVIYYKRK